MLGYMRDTKTPKEAPENLKKIFVASTMTRKLQLKWDLNNVRNGDMLVANYTSKTKDIYD